jgi:hypothetical protein
MISKSFAIVSLLNNSKVSHAEFWVIIDSFDGIRFYFAGFGFAYRVNGVGFMVSFLKWLGIHFTI